MVRVHCALTAGSLLLVFGPLPLQLSEQVGSQQPVPHQASCQRAVHPFVQTPLRPRNSAAVCLLSAALRLQGASDGWVVGADETRDVLDPLLDGLVELLLDLSDQCRVWKHVHEAVAMAETEQTEAKHLFEKLNDEKDAQKTVASPFPPSYVIPIDHSTN